MKKKLILANNRSRLVSLRNLRKGWSTFYIKLILKAFNYPIFREHRLREIPLDMWLSFSIYFAEREVFCFGVTLFYVCIWLKISSSVEFVKWLFKNILTKLILKIEEISIAVIFKQNLLVLKTVLVQEVGMWH